MLEEALAEYMGIQEEQVKNEIDQVYRIGNSYIKKNNLPREAPMKCISFKDEILQKNKIEQLRIQNQDVKTLKEILWKIRAKRKEYQKLT